MCLVTSMKTPFTAKKDLAVIKNLMNHANKWETPLMRVAVRLNSMLKDCNLYKALPYIDYEVRPVFWMQENNI